MIKQAGALLLAKDRCLARVSMRQMQVICKTCWPAVASSSSEARPSTSFAEQASGSPLSWVGNGWQRKPCPLAGQARTSTQLLGMAQPYMAATPATWGAAMEVPWPQV